QVPCHPDSYKMTVIFLKNPDSGKAEAFFHTAQPFGSASSVLNYCRLSQALAHIGRVIFGIPVLNYLDDYFSVEPTGCADSAYDTWSWLHATLGWKLNIDKGVRPAKEVQILGIVLSIKDGKVSFNVPDEKLSVLLDSTDSALKEGHISLASCSKLYMHYGHHISRGVLSRSATLALDMLGSLLRSSKAKRSVPLCGSWYSATDNVVLYTDASGTG
ncbi:hypothetical protein FOL47_004647, partial [Perkinsus chesapeaki]